MMDATASAIRSQSPEKSGHFIWAQIFVLPLVATLAGLTKNTDMQVVLSVTLAGFAWLTLAQFPVVMSRLFKAGWLELSAYVFHAIAVGISGLAVAFRWVSYSPFLDYPQFALAALCGQYLLGLRVISSAPVQNDTQLDRRVVMAFAVVCCASTLIKLYFYYQAVAQFGGHEAIYTQGDQIRDATPLIFRLLATAGPLVGVLAVVQPRMPAWCRILGASAIACEFIIGTRSRPMFLLISCAILIQSRLALKAGTKLVVLSGAILFAFFVFAVGYIRGGYDATASTYAETTLTSLFGVFEAGVFGMSLDAAHDLVFTQVWPLLSPSGLSTIDTVAKLISSTFQSAAYEVGYGYTSSALLEVGMLSGITLVTLFYPWVAVGICIFVRALVHRSGSLIYLIGVATLPTVMLIWRGELWQLAIPGVKAFPVILILFMSDWLQSHWRERESALPPIQRSSEQTTLRS